MCHLQKYLVISIVHPVCGSSLFSLPEICLCVHTQNSQARLVFREWGERGKKNHKPTRHSVRDLQKCCIPYTADFVNNPVPGPYPVRKSSQEGKTKFLSTPGLVFPNNPVQYTRLFPFLVARIFLLFYKFQGAVTAASCTEEYV